MGGDAKINNPDPSIQESLRPFASASTTSTSNLREVAAFLNTAGIKDHKAVDGVSLFVDGLLKNPAKDYAEKEPYVNGLLEGGVALRRPFLRSLGDADFTDNAIKLIALLAKPELNSGACKPGIELRECKFGLEAIEYLSSKLLSGDRAGQFAEITRGEFRHGELGKQCIDYLEKAANLRYDKETEATHKGVVGQAKAVFALSHSLGLQDDSNVRVLANKIWRVLENTQPRPANNNYYCYSEFGQELRDVLVTHYGFQAKSDPRSRPPRPRSNRERNCQIEALQEPFNELPPSTHQPDSPRFVPKPHFEKIKI